MDCAIGCDMGGSFIKIGLVNREGLIVSQKTLPSPTFKKPAELAKRLSWMLTDFFEENANQKINLIGTGIGIPGPVEFPQGILYDPPNLPFKGKVPFGDLFGNYFSLSPVFFDNDATAQTLGEAWQGLGRYIKNFIYIALGTGIGGGIMADGKIYRGTSGMGGEIGHMTIQYNGRKCLCGSKGCLETYASLNGIENTLKEMPRPLPDDLKALVDSGQKRKIPLILTEKIKKGEARWQQVWDIFGKALGVGIGSLINLLNPQRVIISGGLSFYAPFFLPKTIEQAKKFSFSKPAKECEILVSTLKNRSGILGTARLVFDHETKQH